MEGKRRKVQYDEMGEIKKGPWKVEEDEALINHVRRHGPRDWSSIRTKGILLRTGKSCRLRWVNKLRPDLKTGVKFSAEEERTVIDLQAQFGNKWAKISTYLPGRTDNDVKNFWSSRLKRLARILHSPSPSSTNPSFQTQSSSTHKGSSKANSHIDDNRTTKVVPFWNLEYHTALPLNYTPPDDQLSFPHQIPQLQQEFPLPLETQEFIDKLGDPSFLDEFEMQCNGSVLGTAEVPIAPSFVEPQGSYQVPIKADRHDTVDTDRLIYDLPPIEIFHQMGQLPSSSEWP